MEMIDGLYYTEEGSTSTTVNTGRRCGHKRNGHEETEEFKSKNLYAERRRRQKLSDRMLALRAIVPIITNMNKATIIEDAITYIEELQQNVEVLKDHLRVLEVESSADEMMQEPKPVVIEPAVEMKRNGIENDVTVIGIDGKKLWMKIVFENKRGILTNVLETIAKLGYELTHFTMTTYKGGVLVSSFLQGTGCGMYKQTREMLQGIIENAIKTSS
ncbi:hypothetical protein ACFE04_020382 [Oxalis oulophora]